MEFLCFVCFWRAVDNLSPFPGRQPSVGFRWNNCQLKEWHFKLGTVQVWACTVLSSLFYISFLWEQIRVRSYLPLLLLDILTQLRGIFFSLGKALSQCPFWPATVGPVFSKQNKQVLLTAYIAYKCVSNFYEQDNTAGGQRFAEVSRCWEAGVKINDSQHWPSCWFGTEFHLVDLRQIRLLIWDRIKVLLSGATAENVLLGVMGDWRWETLY
jgi:hypothetical protein